MSRASSLLFIKSTSNPSPFTVLDVHSRQHLSDVHSTILINILLVSSLLSICVTIPQYLQYHPPSCIHLTSYIALVLCMCVVKQLYMHLSVDFSFFMRTSSDVCPKLVTSTVAIVRGNQQQKNEEIFEDILQGSGGYLAIIQVITMLCAPPRADHVHLHRRHWQDTQLDLYVK